MKRQGAQPKRKKKNGHHMERPRLMAPNPLRGTELSQNGLVCTHSQHFMERINSIVIKGFVVASLEAVVAALTLPEWDELA